MATLRIKFLATSIKMQMHLQVFLPDSFVVAPAIPEQKRLKVLWLLHGEGGDCSDWNRLTNVERYAQRANIALVLPNMDNSMYMDMAHGGYPYFTYLTEELPGHVRNLLRLISSEKTDNFVAGVGVGGYGAIKWLLNFPDMFSAGACLCGDLDMVSALARKEGVRAEGKGGLADDWAAAFGSSADIANSRDDNLYMLRCRAEAGLPLSPVYLASAASGADSVADQQTAQVLRELGVNPVRYDNPTAQDEAAVCDDAIGDFIRRIIAPCDGGN